MKRTDVDRVLDDALRTALEHEASLLSDESLRPWADRVRHLQQEAVPKTYLVVATTFVTARAMFGERVNVTLLQARAGEMAYAAPSVANVVAGFAKTHNIDLRSTSTAPFNNHPFTFAQRLSDVEPGGRYYLPFIALLDTADFVNRMSQSEARRALALSMVLCRRVAPVGFTVAVGGGRLAYRRICADLARFVRQRADEGRVGQALCAALLDLLHSDVVLGQVNDPDARLAGDVHAMVAGSPWLWCEVKQKRVVTGDITSFMRKVAFAGGQRCLYLALANLDGPGLDLAQVAREANAFDLDVTVVQTPERAIDILTQFAPGEQGALAGRLLNLMRHRLVESNGSSDVLAEFDHLMLKHGTTE